MVLLTKNNQNNDQSLILLNQIIECQVGRHNSIIDLKVSPQNFPPFLKLNQFIFFYFSFT